MATVAVPIFVGSAVLVACTATVAGTGRNCGAVKMPLGEIVPTVVLPPGTPATLQLTEVVVFDAVAVRAAVMPSSTV